ncbi:MAG: hypothetical protein HOM90_10555 [Porticoccaceae bacterium]|jgi:quercetin dioxygenase-like cupin family protein|nr:hypothetical protein [Porticoccaceae bacterium]MBT3798393.1 hypothetical protein [Porticoccaceae bacterium]MBT4164519.1 hypothetical protein [Porticoccaceae bacterium]MBT4211006.1 hypothetical protein [Porticoccaceae bacterium]MBT4591354.1 hypothetical protein [Porticoccaceae bacterium]
MSKISTFKDEAEAYAQIQEAGYHVYTSDYPALKNDFHWHDFDALIYITKGELTVTEQTSGESIICGPGTKLIAGAGVVHREESSGYSAIFGLSVAPQSLTQPVEKPPPYSH